MSGKMELQLIAFQLGVTNIFIYFFYRIPDNLVYIRVPPSGEENSQSALIGGSRRMSKMSTTFKDVPNEGKKS